MSTVLERVTGNGGHDKQIFIKGASEIVKGCCNRYLNENGEIENLNDEMSKQIDAVITDYAKQALRTIALGYKELQAG